VKGTLGAYKAMNSFWIMTYTFHQSKTANKKKMIVIIHISSALHLLGKWGLTAVCGIFEQLERHSPLTGTVGNNVEFKTGNSVESWY